LRIISGKYKGRLISPPKNLRARPTTDFAREALFNILNNRYDFESLNVLDLFSGTGSISYEFASRGVSSIHLVDKDNFHIIFIKKMIKELHLDNIKPVHIDVKSFLKTCDQEYDIVFADPPYDLAWLDTLPDLVVNSGIIKEQGIFILEHPKHMNFSGHSSFFEHRNYGGVNFSFFRSDPVIPV
jgi:16S rRNA (guanine966-N2)-methyltransferase